MSMIHIKQIIIVHIKEIKEKIIDFNVFFL